MSEIERRTAEAEALLNALQERVAALEKAERGDNAGGAEALRRYQTEMFKNSAGLAAPGSEGGDLATIKEERDAAFEENSKLRKDLAKAQYRIQHLKAALREADDKIAAA